MTRRVTPRIPGLALSVMCLGLAAACAAAQPEEIPATAAPLPATASPRPPTQSPTPVIPVTPTKTTFPTPTASQTLQPTKTLPARVEIEDIQGSHQRYKLGCEANTASQMATFFGLPVTQRDFQAALPLSENPETGFVGQVEGWWGAVPPESYGVHAAPVAEVLREYGLNAEAHKQFAVQQIRQEIAAGRPVMVWVIGGVRNGRPVAYTAPDGSEVIVAAYQHTVLVIGYGPDYLSFLDGEQVYQRSLKQFADSWRVLENMAVTVSEPVFLPEPAT
ncbi:MAG: C39 family peptidase [Anaerolineaceae bacterium]|nr:C39 family peptidase [Anaerolineaceae bacterium]